MPGCGVRRLAANQPASGAAPPSLRRRASATTLGRGGPGSAGYESPSAMNLRQASTMYTVDSHTSAARCRRQASVGE